MKFTKKEWENIKFVCNRDDITIGNVIEEGDSVYADIECSEERLEEVLEDAKCEEQSKETLGHLPVYSYRTIKNPKKLHRLMKLNGRRGFYILKADRQKCKEEGLLG